MKTSILVKHQHVSFLQLAQVTSTMLFITLHIPRWFLSTDSRQGQYVSPGTALLSCHYTQIVLKMLKSLCAVLMMTPGSCACQWSSFMSVCPQCWNKSWGGTSTPSSPSPLPASLSRSTLKSQMVIWSSEPDAASTLESWGFHSKDVMGWLCWLNMAMAFTGWLCNTNTNHYPMAFAIFTPTPIST